MGGKSPMKFECSIPKSGEIPDVIRYSEKGRERGEEGRKDEEGLRDSVLANHSVDEGTNFERALFLVDGEAKLDVDSTSTVREIASHAASARVANTSLTTPSLVRRRPSLSGLSPTLRRRSSDQPSVPSGRRGSTT